MILQVKSGKQNIKVLFPSGLIFSDLSAFIACKVIEKSKITNDDGELLNDESKALLLNSIKYGCKALRQTKKKYPHIVLVDLETSDGEKVLITL